jgi:hypothetical protein
MFLVRHANEIMDRDILVLPAGLSFDEFLKGPRQLGGTGNSRGLQRRPFIIYRRRCGYRPGN